MSDVVLCLMEMFHSVWFVLVSSTFVYFYDTHTDIKFADYLFKKFSHLQIFFACYPYLTCERIYLLSNPHDLLLLKLKEPGSLKPIFSISNIDKSIRHVSKNLGKVLLKCSHQYHASYLLFLLPLIDRHISLSHRAIRRLVANAGVWCNRFRSVQHHAPRSINSLMR